MKIAVSGEILGHTLLSTWNSSIYYVRPVSVNVARIINEERGKGLIGQVKRAPHWGVQSRFRVIYVYMYILGKWLPLKSEPGGGGSFPILFYSA